MSQNWFSGGQRTFATVVLGFAGMFGTIIGAAVTPTLVPTASKIPMMNWIWPILSTITMIMFLVFVRRSHPPTPPTRSADIGRTKIPYFKQAYGRLL